MPGHANPSPGTIRRKKARTRRQAEDELRATRELLEALTYAQLDKINFSPTDTLVFRGMDATRAAQFVRVLLGMRIPYRGAFVLEEGETIERVREDEMAAAGWHHDPIGDVRRLRAALQQMVDAWESERARVRAELSHSDRSLPKLIAAIRAALKPPMPKAPMGMRDRATKKLVQRRPADALATGRAASR